MATTPAASVASTTSSSATAVRAVVMKSTVGRAIWTQAVLPWFDAPLREVPPRIPRAARGAGTRRRCAEGAAALHGRELGQLDRPRAHQRAGGAVPADGVVWRGDGQGRLLLVAGAAGPGRADRPQGHGPVRGVARGPPRRGVSARDPGAGLGPAHTRPVCAA